MKQSYGNGIKFPIQIKLIMLAKDESIPWNIVTSPAV